MAARRRSTSESGHLIYAKAGTLLAMPFDPVAVRPAGAAITVIHDARTNTLNGAAPFGVSTSGLFAYLPGESTGAAMTLRSVTRSGQAQVLLDQRLLLGGFQISPDGGRLAVGISDGQIDIWMVDLQTRALSRFTLGAGSKIFPVWSPDGSRLYYTLSRRRRRHPCRRRERCRNDNYGERDVRDIRCAGRQDVVRPCHHRRRQLRRRGAGSRAEVALQRGGVSRQ